ncbi:protein kibra isoform X2 [Hyalella azteca]|uniref:Protein kibra isoform X2 n=1 Tax=Hyalella azteca TaxID=294128 RepID=A0A8B7PPB7_HYAAZ|nr:protein kibra isoform X2 [Hyalella azteca]
MPRRRYGEIPLPNGWEIGYAEDGKIYYIDHNSEKTTWIDPRDSYTKAHTFADCVGQELPYGWEEVHHAQLGSIFVDHSNKSNQVEDPREQWRLVQEQMLSEYLTAASSDLQQRQQVLGVKQHRLALARQHYHALHHSLNAMQSFHRTDGVNSSLLPEAAGSSSALTTSRDSVYSGSSASSSALEPSQLKLEVLAARARVGRLKHELHQERQQLASQQAGINTLTHLRDTVANKDGCNYTAEEAQAILAEVRNIENLLRAGQKEKQQLHQSLKLLGEDIRSFIEDEEPAKSGPAAVTERLSTASQTDFGADHLPLGARLAELTRLRLEYNSAKSQLKCYQQQLADLDLRLATLANTALYSNLSALTQTSVASSVSNHFNVASTAVDSRCSSSNALSGSAHSLLSVASGSSLSHQTYSAITTPRNTIQDMENQAANPALSKGLVSSEASSVSSSALNMCAQSAVDGGAVQRQLQLLSEKEQLLQECKMFLRHARDPLQILELENKIRHLEEEQRKRLLNLEAPERGVCASQRSRFDFSSAMESERSELLSKLRDTVALMVRLEGQLRTLSASTLSMSSSSSLGSLSTSSRGSASSLSFTDIYGGGYQGVHYASSEHLAQSVADLQRRVNKLLSANSQQDKLYAEKLRLLQEGVITISQSTLSLSPRSSLSSLSPPTSCDPLAMLDSNSCEVDDYNTTLTPSDGAANSTVNALPESLEEQVQKLLSGNDVANEFKSNPTLNIVDGDLECDDDLKAINIRLREVGLLAESGAVSGSSRNLLHHRSSDAIHATGMGSHALQHLQSLQNLPQFLQSKSMIDSSKQDNYNSTHDSVAGRSLTRTESSPMAHNIPSMHDIGSSIHCGLNASSNCSVAPLHLGGLKARDASVLDLHKGTADGGSNGGSESGGRGSMSAAVSDESVAGDSGVYEAYPKNSPDCPNTPQIQLKLRYFSADAVLQVCVVKGRHLNTLSVPPDALVCVKIHLVSGCTNLPKEEPINNSNPHDTLAESSNTSVTWCTHPEADLEKPTFGESFTFPIASWSRLRSNTLQLNLWALKPTQDEAQEVHVAFAQVSLADFWSTSCEVLWVNLLHFSLLAPSHAHNVQKVTSPRDSSEGSQPAARVDSSKATTSEHTTCAAQSSSAALLDSATSGIRSTSSTLRSCASNAKEESSDESTVISSQTSTLTRNVGPECLRLNLHGYHHHGVGGELSEDLTCVIDSDEEEDESDSDDCQEDIIERLLEDADTVVEDCDVDLTLVETAEKATNTECVTVPVAGTRARTPSVSDASRAGLMGASASEGASGVRATLSTIMGAALIKRSQTFTPSAAASYNKNICRLNRSDSDSCVGLHRSCSSIYCSASFQRGSPHRRSLRYKTSAALSVHTPTISSACTSPTSLDLALDLAAQKQRLTALQQELESLRALKQQLHQAALETRSNNTPPTWLNSPQTKRTINKLASGAGLSDTPEERRVSKVLRRTKREIHKLRHSRTSPTQPDLLSFKEKMAFFLYSPTKSYTVDPSDVESISVTGMEKSNVLSGGANMAVFSRDDETPVLNTDASAGADTCTLDENTNFSSSTSTNACAGVLLPNSNFASSLDESSGASDKSQVPSSVALPNHTEMSSATPAEKLITRVTLNSPLCRSPHFVTSTPYRLSIGDKTISPVPPTPVRNESLLSSNGGAKSKRLPRDPSPVPSAVHATLPARISVTINPDDGCDNKVDDEEEVPVVPKRTTSLLPSEKVAHRNRRACPSESFACPSSSSVSSEFRPTGEIRSLNESNLTSALSHSTPSVDYKNFLSRPAIPSFALNNDKGSTKSVTDHSSVNGFSEIAIKLRPSSSYNSGTNCENVLPSCEGGVRSSCAGHVGGQTVIPITENHIAKSDALCSIKLVISNKETDVCTSSDVSLTSSASVSSGGQTRQLAARQLLTSSDAASADTELSRPARPHVLFDSDDLGVEV